ncbi:carboxypeptidase-like regulatory domain-containing protein [Methanoculleus sp. Afa-1]|uniref:Carboxypeptidase-like regulatory domain-containing protein n=1 Tax=Methanoculleus formosensis TaxID=2590886 RepID=A0A9E4ZHK2_9EURY|nr:carboxypeptidase-like regulatory domain-containing protein [Methanoculleus sp. Afa-1]MCT8336443.1 carboxypeptidase-like regulatory domain-containing protein [Methanoculleus sp. Afa-1]
MKKSRLVIALLISCVLLCCTAQAVTLRINVVDDKTNDALADASIYIDGDYVGSTNSVGTYSYVHSGKKDLYLKVVRKGYRNWVEYVDYDATRVNVDMIREDATLTFELYDAGTLKPIVGGVVRVTGTDYSDSEVTGSSGSVNFPVKANELYNAEIRASGYHDLSKTVQMESGGRTVQCLLFSNDILGVQVLDAETFTPLKGAEVYIDNARAGETDADGRLQLHLERAKRYSFRVTAPDYQPYQESRYLEVDNVFLPVRLSKSEYPVSITVFNEATKPVEGAEIYLNGTLQGKTSQYGRFTLSNIHAGAYEIVVRAPGYAAWSETRQITGQGEDIVAELGYDRASVTVRAEDPDRNPVVGAVVVIDGQVAGVTDSLGHLKTPLVTNKVHAVAASREGYRNISVDADIPLGITELTIPLVMEKDFNVWVLVAGVGVVAVLLLAAVMVVRHRRAGRNRGRPRRPDSL